MIIKVCGLMKSEQIQQLDLFKNVHWLGFIFSSLSKRKIEKIPFFSENKMKIGVFVNETEEFILQKIKENKLDFIQLHGDESPEFCYQFKDKIKVIKAFGLNEDFDFSILKKYENSVDYFLFDTKTKEYGGSGKQFNWQILDDYQLDIPFILSGGINPESVEDLQKIQHKKLFGIDINSGFEDAIGDKNIIKIKKFTQQMQKAKDYKKPDELGFYGEFGGAFIPELLRSNVEELEVYFKQIKKDKEFKKEFKSLLKNYLTNISAKSI